MFTIRVAHLSDIDEIVDMRIKMLHEVGNATDENDTNIVSSASRDYFIKKFQTGEFQVWLAEQNDKIIGVSGIQFLERPPLYDNITGKEAVIMNVFTDPDRRGEGIASKLLKDIIDYAKENGARRITLRAIGKDRRIYEKLGFHSAPLDMELQL